MLVLARRKGEVIRIGDDVEIIVVELRNDRVKLGIIAPMEVPVHREEVYQAIHQVEGRKSEES